eukprot:scaffold13891_cov125-Isochrysis_galbana.AAC.1
MLTPLHKHSELTPTVPHTVYANAAQAGLEPINPMCISAPPTGPILYACNEQYTKDYIILYPGGIDVEATKEGEPKVHFKVSSRPSNKPNPAKRRVAANILNRIAITMQHYELRGLAQFLRPTDLAAGWAALGFDPINPRWVAVGTKTKSPTKMGKRPWEDATQ